MNFINDLQERFILFDGAIGTMLQRAGLKGGECPEEWNLSKADVLKDIYRAYKKAGSTVVTTNTFGGNRIKLMEYGLEKRLREINIKAVANAREAIGDEVYIAGSVGPTGRFVEPIGDMSFDEAVDIFSEQIGALSEGGVDLIILETMMDIKEVKAALLASKGKMDLPIIASMTFEENLRSLLGTPPEVFAIVAGSLGAIAVGANCSLGIEGIYKALELMSKVTSLPLIAQANAGVPVLKDGKTLFPATPEEMAPYVPKLMALGVRLIGGCCGTTPDHIERMGEELKKLGDRFERKEHDVSVNGTALASRTQYIFLGWGNPPVIAGERINPTGKKRFAAEIIEGKTSLIRKEAKSQMEGGAHILDINVGIPGKDEPPSMKRAVFAVNENCTLPIIIDSSSPQTLEEGLKACDGKAVVNSISGEEKKLSAILPLVKRYGASVIGLTLDEEGIPPTAEGRFRVAEKILEKALNYGIPRHDVVIDCLALTVSADVKGPGETLKAVRMVKEKLGLTTILGVSNISFGLPLREVVNASFLSMAVKAGLDIAIVNPYNPLVMDAYYASLLLAGHDLKAEKYIERFKDLSISTRQATPSLPRREGKKKEPSLETVAELSIEERLYKAIVDGSKEEILPLVEEALQGDWDPLKISNDALIPGLEEVGRLFGENIYFLPQVMSSAETMKMAFERLKKEFKGKKRGCLGKILMATVEGDIHDIGKNIVSTLLENHGFEVIDLGKNVPAERILKEALEKRVDAVGLSALMTTTVMEMEKVIKLLKKEGVKTFSMVGGAVVTQEFANQIGADAYAKDAMEAVKKAKELVKKDV